MQIVREFSSSITAFTLLAFLSAFIVTTPLVALTIYVCRKRGWISRPRADRWHKSTPAFFGGVPIFAGFVVLSSLLVPWSNHLLWRVIGIASLMFFLGLFDDIYHLAPLPKFGGQVLAAVLLISGGVVYPLHGSSGVNIFVSVIWIVGITNAFNLLDNMDGLSAGIALISAGYLTIFYTVAGYRDQALAVAVAAGAIAGFLVFNFSPARIFMGDCGSLLIGFLLGATSLLDVTHVSGIPTFVFAPVAVLAIPIFDTLFVSVTRRLRGQAISQGGTDHSSHRLVRLGVEERRAVLLLYVLSLASGAVALLTRHASPAGAALLIGLWFFFLLLFGIHLFQDSFTQQASTSLSATAQVMTPQVKRLLSRDMLVFLLDPAAMVFSYYLAYVLRFGGWIPKGDKTLMLHSLPIVVGIKLLTSWVCRGFRNSWWRGSISDIYRLGLAALIGEMLAVLTVTGLYRFAGFSRAVFVFDAAVTWLLLLAVRRSFALFRDTIYTYRGQAQGRERVFILGTSVHAELALRFLLEQRIDCAGFIDTNGGGDLRRYVFGLPVLGRLDDLEWLSKKHGIVNVVLPDREAKQWPTIDFQSLCKENSLKLTKLGLYQDEDNYPHDRAANF